VATSAAGGGDDPNERRDGTGIPEPSVPDDLVKGMEDGEAKDGRKEGKKGPARIRRERRKRKKEKEQLMAGIQGLKVGEVTGGGTGAVAGARGQGLTATPRATKRTREPGSGITGSGASGTGTQPLLRKRARATGTTPVAPAQVQNSGESRTYSAAARAALTVYIAQGDPAGPMSEATLRELRLAVTQRVFACHDLAVQILGLTMIGGLAAFECANEESRAWVRATVDSFGGRWRTWLMEDNPPLNRAASDNRRTTTLRIWIRAEVGHISRWTLPSILGQQNPGLNTTQWTITTMQQVGADHLVVMRVPDSEVTLLRARGLQLFFGLERIRILIGASKRAGKAKGPIGLRGNPNAGPQDPKGGQGGGTGGEATAPQGV